VAHLDPSEEDSGVDQRLQALGLLADPPAVVDPDALQIVADEYRQAAIAAFQTKNGIEAAGVIDDATRTALATSHGA
jgi:murein L,D-transpeptidase YcbB/YkuD